MGKRRAAEVSSEDEEKSPPTDDRRQRRQRRLREDKDEDDAEKDENQLEKDGGGNDGEAAEELSQGEEETEEEAKAVPLGDVLKITGKGKMMKNHYGSFEFEGNVYELCDFCVQEDSVLLTPEDAKQKPYVAIIKDITEDVEGNLMVNGQWFYRPEEAERQDGGNWQSRDTRELFYSFHRDDVPAESVMHKCVVHFVPLNKKLPIRSKNPGFFVQKVYDAVGRKLWKLTDKDYEDGKQHEIDFLVQKTCNRLGELLDLDSEEGPVDDQYQPNQISQANQAASKWQLRGKKAPLIDFPKADGVSAKIDGALKANTAGSCTGDLSEYHAVLEKFNALTGDSHRDKCLKRLLQAIKTSCKDDQIRADRMNVSSTDGQKMDWPNAAVSVITTLEKALHELLGADLLKYNQKVRQLTFNFKDGLTAAEQATKEPEEIRPLQMTDARCSRCSEKKVGVADIIHAGGHADRYQLECIACGNNWYASRDDISSLTIETSSAVQNVGAAPWATSKFEDVEKKLIGPYESNKPAAELIKKSRMPYGRVVETQKSSSRTKPQDPHGG
ncbi:hypothetical protein AXF42_Ash009923 [Apostasia shenzhenica]|uniref:BAH domain-containing protein n=1 Tax=Apostasia shenzhenica TaxID=1088818 RepID=A0A2I0ACB7_9ASPA|nr:hypothetical protein AXF42_Ash009923 [Apostasia shenzhenica]